MGILRHYRASEERVHGLLKRLPAGKLLDRALAPLAARLHRWQARVPRSTRNIWLMTLLAGLLLYGLYSLYPLMNYLWNR